jgi:ubiquinone/menaquinone biosynthesis C-methylase UbiE
MKVNWIERWFVNSLLRALMQSLEVRWLQKTQTLTRAATVLEIGCGRGAGARRILTEFQPGFLHTLDLDIRMIQEAKKNLSARYPRRLSLCVGDVFELPFGDQEFDAVFGFGVLHHAYDWRKSVAEVARVLKRGGAYFIEELYPPLYLNVVTKRLLLHPTENRFYSEDLRSALGELGFVFKESIEDSRLGILGVAVKTEQSPKRDE